MSNNCLVTKLNGGVSSDNPQYFNMLHFEAKTYNGTGLGGRQTFVIKTNANGSVTIKTTGSGFFTRVIDPSSPYYVPMTSLTIAASSTETLYFANDDYDVFIEGKYNIASLEVGGLLIFNIEQLGYCDFTEKFKSECNIGNLSNIVNMPDSAIINLSPSTVALKERASLQGDIAAFADCASCEVFNLYNNLDVVGIIESIGKLTSLAELYVNGTAIEGTIERFVAAQIANGRSSVSTSAPIYAHNVLAKLRFGGSVLGGPTNQWITWDSATKITVFGGSGTSFSDYTKVYAKGATAEEIAAWESAGKTVTVIS